MNKRQQILDSTLELIAELGFKHASMALIIKKSNAAAGTIYHYFKNKEELIDTLYSELKKEMGIAIIENIHIDMNPKDRFFLIFKNLFTYYINNPKKFEFLEDYSNSPLVRKEIKAINKRHYQLAIDFFDDGIRTGIFRNLNTDLIINLVFSHVSTLTRMVIMEEIELSHFTLENTIQSSWDSVRMN